MAASVAAHLLVLIVFAAVPVIFATDYTVGDSQGWSTGVDYTTWAADKSFKVGDSLSFQYGMLHSVNEVTKSDYDGCSASNSIQSYSDQNTKIALSAPGSRYFICGTPGHCSGGMKLAVTVAAASTGGGSPATPSTPSTTPAGSSPNPTTPSTSTPSGPKSQTPSSTNTNAAAGIGFNGGNVVMVGASLLGLALMG